MTSLDGMLPANQDMLIDSDFHICYTFVDFFLSNCSVDFEKYLLRPFFYCNCGFIIFYFLWLFSFSNDVF